MGTEYIISIAAHPSIYSLTQAERNLQVYFHEPSKGIDSDTGLLLIMAGYGELADSPYYLHVREVLADHHNMVVVQCDYFGYEFMQESRSVQYDFNPNAIKNLLSKEEFAHVYEDGTLNIEKFFEVGSHYPMYAEGKEVLLESAENLNDMGIMQAMDQLTAIFAVNAVLVDNGYTINRSRVYIYGQSHTAYLAYLCNALAPQLFSCIIDNSGWLFPVYLENQRILNRSFGKMSLTIRFDYLVGKLGFDQELLHLPSLYKHFNNQAKIICWHGTDDSFVQPSLKKAFCQSIQGANCQVVSKDHVNGTVFKSVLSGLGVNYLDFFQYALKQHQAKEAHGEPLMFAATEIETKSFRYTVDFSTGMPTFNRMVKERFGSAT